MPLLGNSLGLGIGLQAPMEKEGLKLASDALDNIEARKKALDLEKNRRGELANKDYESALAKVQLPKDLPDYLSEDVEKAAAEFLTTARDAHSNRPYENIMNDPNVGEKNIQFQKAYAVAVNNRRNLEKVNSFLTQAEQKKDDYRFNEENKKLYDNYLAGDKDAIFKIKDAEGKPVIMKGNIINPEGLMSAVVSKKPYDWAKEARSLKLPYTTIKTDSPDGEYIDTTTKQYVDINALKSSIESSIDDDSNLNNGAKSAALKELYKGKKMENLSPEEIKEVNKLAVDNIMKKSLEKSSIKNSSKMTVSKSSGAGKANEFADVNATYHETSDGVGRITFSKKDKKGEEKKPLEFRTPTGVVTGIPMAIVRDDLKSEPYIEVSVVKTPKNASYGTPEKKEIVKVPYTDNAFNINQEYGVDFFEMAKNKGNKKAYKGGLNVNYIPPANSSKSQPEGGKSNANKSHEAKPVPNKLSDLIVGDVYLKDGKKYKWDGKNFIPQK